jgi:GAF domain-containing protein/nitrogen-specific signal transduction histidine kinase
MTATQDDVITELGRVNAELRRERDAALARELALGEVLAVINGSPGNPALVFDAILGKAHSLCGAETGQLVAFDGEYFRVQASNGMPEEFVRRVRRLFRPNNRLQRLIQGDRFIHVPDVRAVELEHDDEVGRSLVEVAGIRTILLVPLRKADTLLGFISANRREVSPFSGSEIGLLESFAAQAVIAMENARLLGELRQRTGDLEESLEYQTATSDVLKVISRSTFDLDPVFQSVVTTAARLCHADQATIYRHQDGEYRWAAGHGLTPEYERIERAFRGRPGTGTLVGRVALEGRIVEILDAWTDPLYEIQDEARVGGVRTMLGVPLLRNDMPIGLIALARQRIESFTERQIALVSTFADQAVIAIENTRLLTEQQEALEQQTATAEILQVINASPGNLAPVFEAMLEKATRLCQSAFGIFATYDGEAFHNVAFRGVPPALLDRFRPTFLPRPEFSIYRIVQGEDVVQVADIMDDEVHRSSGSARRRLVELAGARTQLMIALRKDNILLGAINVFRQEVRPFSERQVRLLQSFAAQAVIAMENARLITEQREALEQQTATSEVLQVINASPGDLAPVFDAMLEKAVRLCDSAFGVLHTYDGALMHQVATVGLTPEQQELFADRPPAVGQPTGRIADGEDVVHLSDAREQDGYRAGFGPTRNFVDRVGARTVMWVALRKDKVLVGILSIFRREVRSFTDKEIALVQNFAAQAVIAMENARLIDEQREALERQTATTEILQVINANPGTLAPVFDAMLEKAAHICDAAFGSLATYDGERFQFVALRGASPEIEAIVREPMKPPPDTAMGQIARGETCVHVADITAEASYQSWRPAVRSAFVELSGFRTMLWVALRKEDTILGLITIYRQGVRPFSEKQVALLQDFAAQAVIAMENARLLNEVRRRQEELRITFENMGDGVAMFDETQHLVAWNHKFQVILDVPDEVIARRQTFSEYVRYLAERGEYGVEADSEEEARRLTEQASQYRAYERTRPDGRVIEIRHNPVPDGGFVLIYTDITERKRNEATIAAARDAAEEATRTIEAAFRELKTAQANLIQAEKMASLGQLTAGIAHEIKNPLNFVNNFAELSVDLLGELKEAIAPAEATLSKNQRAEIEDVSALLTSNLQKITEHGKRADGIVRSMLEHSRGSSGERRTVEVNPIVEEALNLAYHGARAQDQDFNITLERDYGADIPPIKVNPQDITRVILNLISNGFYAASKRAHGGSTTAFAPTLKVATRNANDAVEIRVRDNGIGIPVDIRDKLFQPFFTTKPTGEGTGLGLSITYDIVTKAHGGTISMDSVVDEFTEFVVTLPREVFANAGGQA